MERKILVLLTIAFFLMSDAAIPQSGGTSGEVRGSSETVKKEMPAYRRTLGDVIKEAEKNLKKVRKDRKIQRKEDLL